MRQIQGHGSTKFTALSLPKGSPEETEGLKNSLYANLPIPVWGRKILNLDNLRQQMSIDYRPSRVHQIRGSTDEATGAYTMTYVRIAEEGV